MWSGVDQAECRVGLDSRISFVERRIELFEDADPQLHVFALRLTDLSSRVGRQAFEVAILDADQVRFAEGEVEMELDEGVERGCRGVGRLGCGRTALVEPSADPDEQFDQDGILVGEVSVDGRSADSGGGAEIFESNAHESAFGDQACGGAEELTSAICLHLIAPGRSRYLLRGHSFDLSARVTWTTQLIIVNLVSVIEH